MIGRPPRCTRTDQSLPYTTRFRSAVKAGVQPLQIAHDLDWSQFAAINGRLTDFPGIQPIRGYARVYPDGPAVAHLLGYVGAARAEQYQETKDPQIGRASCRERVCQYV